MAWDTILETREKIRGGIPFQARLAVANFGNP